MNNSLSALLTVHDIRERYKIGNDKAYTLVKQDGFPAFKIKGRIYIKENLLEEWETNQIIKLQRGA